MGQPRGLVLAWGRTGRCRLGTEISKHTMRVFCSLYLLTWETGVLGGGLIFALVTQIRNGGAKSSLRPVLPTRTPGFWKTWPSGMGQGITRLPGELGREVQGGECGELAFLGVVWVVTGNTRRTV